MIQPKKRKNPSTGVYDNAKSLYKVYPNFLQTGVLGFNGSGITRTIIPLSDKFNEEIDILKINDGSRTGSILGYYIQFLVTRIIVEQNHLVLKDPKTTYDIDKFRDALNDKHLNVDQNLEKYYNLSYKSSDLTTEPLIAYYCGTKGGVKTSYPTKSELYTSLKNIYSVIPQELYEANFKFEHVREVSEPKGNERSIVEREIEFMLKDDITLRGRVDLLCGDSLFDIKCTHTSEEGSEIIQMLLYALILKNNNRNIKYGYIINVGKGGIIKINFEELDCEVILQKLKDLKNGLIVDTIIDINLEPETDSENVDNTTETQNGKTMASVIVGLVIIIMIVYVISKRL